MIGLLLSAAVLTAGNVEVVIPDQAPKSLSFAASEMTNFLARTLGESVPIVNRETHGKTPILLGEALWDEPSVRLADLPRDAFAVAVGGGRVRIAGRDDPKQDPARILRTPSWGCHKFDHATLNGVYSFLERVANVRFYFPGELGTCILPARRIVVPDGVRTEAPQQTVRSWSYYTDGKWVEGTDADRPLHPMKALNSLRLRASTFDLRCCHGLNGFKYVERFAKSHPEYFALDASGKRMIDGTGWKRGHLCLSSGVREEIFRDCLSWCKGEPASARGIPSGVPGVFAWGRNVSSEYIDLMPQDGRAACFCERCQAAMRKDGRRYPSTELVWGLIREVAARLKKEGYTPVITCMSYADYADVPDFDLPDNLRVMIARRGPWALTDPDCLRDDISVFRKWTAKTGQRPWSWSYAMRGRANGLNIPDVPGWAPRTWATYYAGVAPHLFGTFSESETDRAIDNLMGYYLKSKICWDAKFDWQAALEEFYGRMFGPASGPMKRALETIETLWAKRVAGNNRMTDVGPIVERPSAHTLWREIYDAGTMKELKADFDAAARAVRSDSLEARRIELFRQWMYEPPARAGEAYRKSTDVEAALALRKADPEGNLIDESRWIIRQGVRDASDFLVPPCSFKMTATQENSTRHFFGYLRKGTELKAGGRYRFSYFVKTDLEPVQKSGGVGPMVWLENKALKWKKTFVFPSTMNFLSGKLPWIAQTFDFEVPKDMPVGTDAGIFLRIRGAKGDAWFNGVRLEEVK